MGERLPFRSAPFLVLALVLAGCATGLPRGTEAPEVSLADVRLVDVTLLEQQWELTLRARNPNPWDIPLKSLEYRILVDDVPFLSGVSAEPVDIPGLGDGLVRTRVTTGLLDTLARMRRFDYQPGKAMNYRIEGSVRLGRGSLSLPFRHQGEIVLPRIPMTMGGR